MTRSPILGITLRKEGIGVYDILAPAWEREKEFGLTSEATVDNPAKREGDGQALKLLVVFERDEDGWEVASCPTLPGCHSQGRTRREALENVREAIRGYLTTMREDGVPLPCSSEYEVVEVTA